MSEEVTPFMRPQYYEGPWVLAGDVWFNVYMPAEDYAGEDHHGAIMERGEKGVLVRLSAPGYLDATDWELAESMEKARDFLVTWYHVCPECGAMLDEVDESCPNGHEVEGGRRR